METDTISCELRFQVEETVDDRKITKCVFCEVPDKSEEELTI